MTQLTDSAPAQLGRKRDPGRDEDILVATLEVLAETGYDGMTIDMVAARAKAGKATLYRRWASKGELVIDAIACMKKGDVDPAAYADTGSLRGDLISLIKPQRIQDAERKMRIMAGLTSLIAHDPELAEAARTAIAEPRIALYRMFLQRAIDRGEISADLDIDTLALVGTSMITYRVIMLNKPADRAFIESIIDRVILPAVGLSAP